MSVELIIGLLLVATVVWVVCKMVKVAAFCGIAAAVLYVGHQFALPFWETHLAPYVALAGSYF